MAFRNISNTRIKRVKLNIAVSLVSQFVTLFCGLVVPRLMIGTYGSEAYGATASIAQFLSYITLLEGGIGGVARAALYKPLAENNIEIISEIIAEIKRFFRVIAYIFIIYVLVLASGFKQLSGVECFDWLSSFLLVVVISISTFAEYFIGISYSVLTQAAQRNYISVTINIFTRIFNTIFTVILVNMGSELLWVKLMSSCIFVVRPFLLWIYIGKNFKLKKCRKGKKAYLKQKWTGLGQHIAFFLHSNTDIVVLTILTNLKVVAVYSVYYMVINQIQNVVLSFITGMEALFGDMIAKSEAEKLHKIFGYYETMISIITTVLFSVTAIMIIPFVEIYTARIEDTNYIEPIFALILILASVVYCLRTPYHSMTIAAGHFKQTQMAAYGEAIINLILSVILVFKLGLIGVAIGTLAATSFRLIYYAVYLTNHIFNRSISLFIRRAVINISIFVVIFILGRFISNAWSFKGYYSWIVCAALVTILAVIITLTGNYVFYKYDFRMLVKKSMEKRIDF